jgi:fructosamine-3-kinase
MMIDFGVSAMPTTLSPYRVGVDLEYLRTHPQNIGRLLTHQRIRTTPVPGGDICTAERLTLDDGTDVFAKSLSPAPTGFFAAEATGLRWLAAAGAVPVPEVIAVTDELLVLEWVSPGAPSAAAAEAFGRGLAALHRAGAPGFGAAAPGYIGSLPLDNTPAPTWAEFYAERRVRPYVRAAVDRGHLTPDAAAAIERYTDRLDVPGEPPARLHGDLWSGNVHWAADGRAWLVDPAAHGGHRETDLAMLALFGAPHLNRIVAAYDEEHPLAAGWRDRIGLHQLHPLLVHAVLFGGGYGARAAAIATRSRPG